MTKNDKELELLKQEEHKFYELDDDFIKVETINPAGMKRQNKLLALERLMYMGVNGEHTEVYLGVCKLFPEVYFDKFNYGERAQKLYDYAEQNSIQSGTEMCKEYFTLPNCIVMVAPRGYKNIIPEVVFAT